MLKNSDDMEKMIIDIQRQPDGLQTSEEKDAVLHERFDYRLDVMFTQEWPYNNKPKINSHFYYSVENGLVTSMTYEFRMKQEKEDDLNNLCIICAVFYDLYFRADKENERVYFHADNIYDMACLIQSLIVKGFDIAGGLFAVVDKESNIEEAFIKWERQEKKNYQELMASVAEEEEWMDDEVDAFINNIDAFGVRYSLDGKHLICATLDFNGLDYCVPDGVEEICGMAFFGSKHFLHVSIPRSVKRIGHPIFGETGGELVIRDK